MSQPNPSPLDALRVQPVILAGGSGTRLWPLSRAGFPKQFLALNGTSTLLQESVQRLRTLTAGPGEASPLLVVCNDEHRFLALEQLREIGAADRAQLLLEPCGRNTAPALTLAALQAVEDGSDPVLVVTPADQTVTDLEAFTAALNQAVVTAAGGAIVILGIVPDRPETGYGYIRAEVAGATAARVAQFVEKPDAAKAVDYLRHGGYFWNSGLFVLRASAWLKALGTFRPDILDAVRGAWTSRATDMSFLRPNRAKFEQVPAESVDYAVMERCPGSAFDIRMLSLNAGWNDLGAWDAVWQVAPKDDAGNCAIGDAMIHDSRGTLVHASSRLVSAVGVDNLVVVETPDAVLVIDRSRSQEVKQIVDRLGRGQREEHALHRKVHRPWGWYDSIDQGARFQVKRIMVKPGASLSLQMHHHRAEHWVVVSGTAQITCGEKTVLLTENQSTFIPLGEKHRLANPGMVPLEIIEIQSGSYLGEDDIVRFEDSYGRASDA